MLKVVIGEHIHTHTHRLSYTLQSRDQGPDSI